MTDIGHKTIEPFVGPIIADEDEPLRVTITDDAINVNIHSEQEFGTSQTALQNVEAALIAPANPNRQAITILNTGTVTFYIMNNRAGNSTTGYPITGGASIIMDHQRAIYAVAPNATAANPATLALIWQVNH